METDGEDANPTGDVPFTVEERTTPSQDGEKWKLSRGRLMVTLQTNGTTLTLTTQICINSGVCDPPVNHEVAADDGTYSLSLTPPRRPLLRQLAGQRQPTLMTQPMYSPMETGTRPGQPAISLTVTYGGIHASGNGCEIPAEEEGFLPFVGVSLMAATVSVLQGSHDRSQNQK